MSAESASAGSLSIKFASDKFEERRQELIEEGKEKYLEMKDYFLLLIVFCLSLPPLFLGNILKKMILLHQIKIKKKPEFWPACHTRHERA